jgi:hypothetical protein
MCHYQYECSIALVVPVYAGDSKDKKICYCKGPLDNAQVEIYFGDNCPHGGFIHAACLLKEDQLPESEDFMCKSCRVPLPQNFNA